SSSHEGRSLCHRDVALAARPRWRSARHKTPNACPVRPFPPISYRRRNFLRCSAATLTLTALTKGLRARHLSAALVRIPSSLEGYLQRINCIRWAFFELDAQSARQPISLR